MDRTELERLDRERLVARAQAAGIKRARLLTRPELIDELLRLDPVIDEAQLKRSRGFFGRARDLLSRVVERGLHLPDAADRLRAALGTTPGTEVQRPEPQAVPTVTLAEIYAAQGHKGRAIETLKRVLEVEPEHGEARGLLEKLQAVDYVAPPTPALPEEREEANTIVEEPPPSSPVLTPEDPAFEADCFAIPRENRFHVVWRLTRSTRPERLAEDAKPQNLVVRAVVIVPSWDGPKVETRDTSVSADAGEATLDGFPPRAIVRIAVGIMAPSFVPLAHSPAIETSGGALTLWSLSEAGPMRLPFALPEHVHPN